MNIEAVIVLLYSRYLRKTVQTFSPNEEWDKILKFTFLGSAIGIVLEMTLGIEDYTVWVWSLGELILTLLTFRLSIFEHARKAMLGLLPVMVLFFIKTIIQAFLPKFYSNIDKYLSIAVAIGLTWLGAMMWLTSRERKALEKERQKRLMEEERHRIIEAQKSQLEGLVNERTQELVKQKEELENALVELQATQKQLIQSEKMASLGELTAGIAHEIQNPLNFVNNFSEVSVELINEIKDEIHAGNNEAVLSLAEDIEKNLSKITHHGKRADAIVKGMLQHSRSSTGAREPADINSLADEYLRLSYHGLRAKDKNFNASMHTSFDENIGMIDIIPQDIGRVLLNLFTNAFYSVTEKKKRLAARGLPFEPAVSVETKLVMDFKDDNQQVVLIKVHDNGLGIPQHVIDKIYQPFFTTKPSGEGTGLGLSLSYDIIQGHQGTLQVDTKEGEFAEFIIELPVVRS